MRAPWSSAHSSSAHGPVDVGERDVGRGEDAVLVGEAPVLVEPPVEGAEQERDRLGVVLERLLVDHPEGREQPAPRRGRARRAWRGGRRGRGTRRGCGSCGLEQLERVVAVRVAAEVVASARPGLATGSKVGLTTARLTLPPSTWYVRPSISAHWTTRGPERGVEVAGEGVERLVVVVVGVEGPVAVRRLRRWRSGTGWDRSWRAPGQLAVPPSD